MKYIADLREGESVREVYLCKEKRSLVTKAGKNYDSLILQDKTGTLDAKVWNLTNGIDEFENMDYIFVDGQVTSFQGSLQLNVTRIKRCQEGEYNPSDYMPTSERNIEEMYQELKDIVLNVKNPYLQKLLTSFFIEDADFIKAFKFHSAAKMVHHGFIGGLLEHSLGVARACEYIAASYSIVNHDLLVTAGLLHDIGKMKEISVFPENDYTDDGQLLGHIYIGTEMIGYKIREIEGFPAKMESELKHCILAHHGELEYGSPKKPALVEALALNLADNMDSKLQTMKELFASNEDKSDWLGYNRLFDSNIRKTSC